MEYFPAFLLLVGLTATDVILKLFTGVVGTYVIQAAKKLLKISGRYAVIVSVILSAALAMGVMYITGELTFTFANTQELVAAAAQVFAVATVAYQFLKDSMPVVLQVNPNTPTKS
jgi:hypothetical protein